MKTVRVLVLFAAIAACLTTEAATQFVSPETARARPYELMPGERIVAVPARAFGVFSSDRVYVQFGLAGYKEPRTGQSFVSDQPATFGSVPVGPDALERARAALVEAGIRPERISASLAPDARSGIQLGDILVSVEPISLSAVEDVLKRATSANIHDYLRAARIVDVRSSCDAEQLVRREAESAATAAAARFARNLDLRLGPRLEMDVRRRFEERDEYPLALCGKPFVPALPNGPSLTFYKSPEENYRLAEMLRYRLELQGGAVFGASSLPTQPRPAAVAGISHSSVRDMIETWAGNRGPRSPIVQVPPNAPYISVRGSFGVRIAADGTLLVLRGKNLSKADVADTVQAVRAAGVAAQDEHEDATTVYVLSRRTAKRSSAALLKNIEDAYPKRPAFYLQTSVIPYIRDCPAIEDFVVRSALRNARERAAIIASAAQIPLDAMVAVSDAGAYRQAICVKNGDARFPEILAAMHRADLEPFDPPYFGVMHRDDALFSKTIVAAWTTLAPVTPPLLPKARWWTAYGTFGIAFQPYDSGVDGGATVKFSLNPAATDANCRDASFIALRLGTSAAVSSLVGKPPRVLIDDGLHFAPEACYLGSSMNRPYRHATSAIASQRVLAVP